MNKEWISLNELAAKAERNPAWLRTKVQTVQANCGGKKITGNWSFPPNSIEFVRETWPKRKRRNEKNG